MISQPKWGSNGEDLDKGFVCNKGEWGHVGRNRVSPLEMGTRGGGRGVHVFPSAEEIAVIAVIADIASDRKTKPTTEARRHREQQGSDTVRSDGVTKIASIARDQKNQKLTRRPGGAENRIGRCE